MYIFVWNSFFSLHEEYNETVKLKTFPVSQQDWVKDILYLNAAFCYVGHGWVFYLDSNDTKTPILAPAAKTFQNASIII